MSVTNMDIVNSALEFKGKLKYVFGSDDITGGSGDCSSFTEHIFSIYGFNIGSESEAQYTQGIPVKRSDLQAGDLVFFRNTYDSGKLDGVSHVGISLGGDKFINLNSDGCVVNSINETYWLKHYLGAKRVQGVRYTDTDYVYKQDLFTNSNAEDDNMLNWWGDIVRVVVVFGLLIAGLGFTAGAVGVQVLKGGN